MASIDVRAAAGSVERSRDGASALTVASLSAALLATVSSVAGLLSWGTPAVTRFETVAGERVELFGRGLYEHDSLFIAGNNFASDIVMLFVAVPLLLISLSLSRRGSLRGRLLVLGTLGYFVYHSATYALGGVAFNDMFLVYVALFSSSLLAFVTCFALLKDARMVSKVSPRRFAGIFMLFSAGVTLAIWSVDPVAALVSGEPPAGLEAHTTLFTHALDIAVIVPAAAIAGMLILRNRELGYLVAVSLLVLEALLLPLIAIGTAAQLDLGISFEPGEIVGPIAGFSILALLSVCVLVRILTSVPWGSKS